MSTVSLIDIEFYKIRQNLQIFLLQIFPQTPVIFPERKNGIASRDDDWCWWLND